MNDALAAANACLTVVALAAMLAGWRAIRRGQIARHRAFMLTALAASAAFLVCFVVRFGSFGFRQLGARGVTRVAYQVVFLSHEPLAVVNVPLVLAAALLALSGRFEAHREVARWALPIWVYVAATGIMIHVFLTCWPSGR